YPAAWPAFGAHPPARSTFRGITDAKAPNLRKRKETICSTPKRVTLLLHIQQQTNYVVEMRSDFPCAIGQFRYRRIYQQAGIDKEPGVNAQNGIKGTGFVKQLRIDPIEICKADHHATPLRPCLFVTLYFASQTSTIDGGDHPRRGCASRREAQVAALQGQCAHTFPT